ncbi:MAG: protein BatD [Deltaproteobacteria bacterium]|nr:protein BatD [Deltaproteobacteria bacterium]
MRRTWTKNGSALLVILALAIITVSGCRAAKPKADHSAIVKTAAIIKHYGKGPIKLTMRLDRRRINSAQFFHLILRIEGPENYTFELPSLKDGETLGDFIVAGSAKTTPALNATGIYQQQSYRLEPERTGKFKLPSLTVSAWEKGRDKAPVIELATGKIPLTVESLLLNGKAKLADIVPPVAQPFNWLLWAAGGAGAAVILFICWFFWRRHKSKEAPLPPPIPPYLRALQAMEALQHKDLPGQGHTKQFYAELSDILRQYIEDHLGLRAAEQTTEEFLLTSAATLRAGHKRLLRDFMTHCDLVKFAEYQPDPEDIVSALVLCRQFIDDTGNGTPEAPQTGPAYSPTALELKR